MLIIRFFYILYKFIVFLYLIIFINKQTLMKNYLLSVFAICISVVLYSQENKLVKQYSDNACQCIDSIDSFDKTKEQVATEIHACIAKETRTYYLFKMLTKSLEEGKKSTDDSQVTITMNEDSPEFKSHYYELETYCMDNCKSLNELVASSNKLGNYSMSKNPVAIELYGKGDKEVKKQNYKKAIEYYEQALQIDSLFAFAWDNLGLCYRKIGNYPKALESYQKSLKLDPKGSMPLHNIPIVYSYMGQYESAIAAYEKILKIDPNDPEIYYGIGQIYYEYLKDYEQSLECMCKAYNLYVAMKSPYRTDAERIISAIYTQMKNAKQEDLFNEILKKNNITWK